MSNFKIFLATLILASSTHSLLGQEKFLFSVVDSKFAEHKESINQLIELQVMDNQLGLSRRWQLMLDRENVNETPGSKLEAAIEKHIERGIPEEMAQRLAANELGRGHPPVCDFMAKLHENLGGGGGSSSSGSGSQRRRYRGKGTSMGIRIEDQSLQLDLIDERQNGFDIKVVDMPQDKFFLFRFSSLNEIINVRQSRDEIKFSYIIGDDAGVITESSFSELLKKHPKPVNAYLVELWAELGIAMPMSLSDEEAVAAAVTILDSIHDDEMQVIGLLDSLGSDSLSDRKEAANELTAGLYKWKYWVENLKNKFEYDKISKDYLNRVLKGSPGTPAQDYANSLDLTDTKTLVRILESANDAQKASVEEQLRLVTGEKREGVAAWKEYLSITTDQK